MTIPAHSVQLALMGTSEKLTKNALISGASRGLARAIVINLRRAGYRCALVARKEEGLQETVAAFIKKEVFPYTPDAWVDGFKTQSGHGISFTRYFYKSIPMRTLDEIKTPIQLIIRVSRRVKKSHMF